jgi:hypothetical protein
MRDTGKVLCVVGQYDKIIMQRGRGQKNIHISNDFASASKVGADFGEHFDNGKV